MKSVIDYTVKRFIAKSTWAEIRTAYASGIGLRELARSMGIPAGTILARAKREGWSKQINHVTPFEAVSASMQKRGERHVERMAGVSERAVDHIETMDGPEILGSIDQIEKLDKVARRTFKLDDHLSADRIDLSILSIGGNVNLSKGR